MKAVSRLFFFLFFFCFPPLLRKGACTKLSCVEGWKGCCCFQQPSSLNSFFFGFRFDAWKDSRIACLRFMFSWRSCPSCGYSHQTSGPLHHGLFFAFQEFWAVQHYRLDFSYSWHPLLSCFSGRHNHFLQQAWVIYSSVNTFSFKLKLSQNHSEFLST